MIASSTPSSSSLARRIALRAGEFKDEIGLSVGNFIAASSAAVVGATLASQSVVVAHDTVAKEVPAGELLSYIPFIGTVDIWMTAVSLVFCCIMGITWILHLLLEKTLLRKERASADQVALILTAVMCASIGTVYIVHHLADIAHGFNWVVYELQLHLVGFDNVTTSVPSDVA